MKYGSCKKVFSNACGSKYDGLKDNSIFDYIEATIPHFYKKKAPGDSLHIPTLNLAKEKHQDWLINYCKSFSGEIILHFHKGKMESYNIKSDWIEGLKIVLKKVDNKILLENCNGLTEFWKIEYYFEIFETCKEFKNFGLCLDIGHAYLMGKYDWINKILKTNRVERLHFHDACGKKINPNKTKIFKDHLPIEDGEINFKNINFLNNPIKDITVEIITTDDKMIESLKKIKKLIERRKNESNIQITYRPGMGRIPSSGI